MTILANFLCTHHYQKELINLNKQTKIFSNLMYKFNCAKIGGTRKCYCHKK